MAVHAHSTTVPGRPLLPLGASAPGPLIPPLDTGSAAATGLPPNLAPAPSSPKASNDWTQPGVSRQAGDTRSKAQLGWNSTPIDIDAVIQHLAMRPQAAEAFLIGLADAMIQEQDKLDPDPDLEPSFGYLLHGAVADECEPDHDGEETLGWPACMSQVHLGNNTADGDLTALERHGTGFILSGPDDHEPSLGSIGSSYGGEHRSQELWSTGCTDDREEECEDEGAPDSDEPSLGATEHINQRLAGWNDGEGTSGPDLEEVNEDGCDMQGSDNGIGDIEGVAEQWGARVAFGCGCV